MIPTELQEIKEYWAKKYPNADFRLWSNEDMSKHFAHILGVNSNEYIQADTIGELINQGELFLRQMNR